MPKLTQSKLESKQEQITHQVLRVQIPMWNPTSRQGFSPRSIHYNKLKASMYTLNTEMVIPFTRLKNKANPSAHPTLWFSLNPSVSHSKKNSTEAFEYIIQLNDTIVLFIH